MGKLNLFLGLICFLTISCETNHKTDEEVFIPVEKSELYARLIGNSKGPIVVNLHGGPGGYSGFDHEFNRKHLEEDYLIVYLDQRGCGKSKEENDFSMLNMKQAVKDLDAVIGWISEKYPDRKINLLGGSWGGTLGLLYMIEHQDKINSFICASGKADGIYPIKDLIDFERNLAMEKLNSTNEQDSVRKYQAMINKLNEIAESNWDSLYDDVTLLKFTYPEKLGFNVYWANKQALAEAVKLGKDSAYYKRAKYSKKQFEEALRKGELVNQAFRNDSEYNHLNILSELSRIQKPVLVLQGDQDRAIGPKQAQMIYNSLVNVPDDKKAIHILHNAAHNLNMEAEKEYYGYVKAFLQKENIK